MRKRVPFMRQVILLAAAIALSCLCSLTVFASAKIKSVDYDGNGKVEVSFTTKVNYKKVKVTVKDKKGMSISAVITDKDSDDLEFRMSGYPQGEELSFTISGIKKRTEKKYRSIKGKVWIPAGNKYIRIKDVEYDSRVKEVEFEFLDKVIWKKAKVTITDGKRNYVVKIKEKDATELEVKVKQLEKGKIYDYSISGIAKKGDTKYITITGNFRA